MNSWRGRIRVEPVVIVLLALVAYLPTFRAGFIWDDDAHITDNPTLQSADGLGDMWLSPTSIPQYYPLTHTAFWVEYHLWGLNPAGYHTVNVLLHAANAMLVWLVLRRLGVPGAFWAGAIFAVHPILVETVAWASEQKTLLSASFYLLSFLAYWRFSEPGGGKTRFYVVSLGLFICALLSKTVACSMPAAVLLMLWGKQRPIRVSTVSCLAPFFAIGLALSSVTAKLEVTHVGAYGPAWELSPAQRCIIAGRALWFYVGKVVCPVGLTFNYPRWEVDPHQAWQWIGAISAVGVIAALLVGSKKIGRGPAMAALFFAGTLLPALGFFNIYPMRYSFVADHFAYMASIAPIALVAALAGSWRDKVRWVGGGMLVVALMGLTFRHAEDFHDRKTVWLSTLVNNPRSAMAHYTIGKDLLAQGDTAGAAREAMEAMRDNPVLFEPMQLLGSVSLCRGDFADACRWYGQALPLAPTHMDLHRLMAYTHDDSRALDELETAYRLRLEGEGIRPDVAAESARGMIPDKVTAREYDLFAEQCQARGDRDRAEAADMKALAIDPGFAPARRRLDRLLHEEIPIPALSHL